MTDKDVEKIQRLSGVVVSLTVIGVVGSFAIWLMAWIWIQIISLF